jgi:putative transposase
LIGYRQTIKQPKGYATMSKSNVIELAGRDESQDPLTDMLRAGAQQLIQQAVEAELQHLLHQHAGNRTPEDTAGVVRNGYLPERELQTSLGPIPVRIPKVRSKTGEAVTFRSALVPPYVRKTKTLEAALPWLYLKGVSSGEMGAALEVLVGPEAKGLSASTVSRLKQTWAQEYRQWNERRLDRDQWVYIWADGVYSGLRAEQAKLCALVIIGVNERGEKHFLAIEDGVRESTQSWREVLLNLKSRGLNMPKLAIGDGAMGFWAALEEVLPETRQQRCWMHKTMNVLNCLPKATQPKAKQALHNIWQAETKVEAEQAFEVFIATYDAKYPKATLCLQKDREELMAFYSFPAKHWQSIRTSNPIESTFGTIRHRTKRSKGCLSRDGMLYMMFKLGMCAEDNWRRLRGFSHLAQVITGVKFRDGIAVKAADQVAA